MQKSVSIVIPAYNEQRHIAACLDAIAAQTVQPDEVIVVDNNSTDQTVAIVRRYSFVKVVHEKEQGIVYARNRGFDTAKGDLIGRIDADTLLPHDWIERIKIFYEQPRHAAHALTGGGYFYNVRAPRINGWLQGQLAYRANRLVVGYYILWGSNMALPRELWLAVRQKVCMRTDVHEDMDLAIHLHRNGYKITYKESLRVGVYLKRVGWHQRRQLREHMNRWPRTLRQHHFKLWWLGVAGNITLWYFWQPIGYTVEGLARLTGKAPIRID